MAKFMFAFRGGSGMAASPEQQAQVMQAWGAWYGRLGGSLVDGGAPFGGRVGVDASGPTDVRSGLGGYTIVSAPSLADASSLADGCPVLADGGTVDVYECIDMGM